jgi:hypothetical protein
VAASCDSGEVHPAVAEVAGDVFDESDSDSSERGQHVSHEVQGAHGSMVNKGDFEMVSQGPLVNSDEVMTCCSNCVADIGSVEDKQVGESDEAKVVRGMSTSTSAVQGLGEQSGDRVDLVDSPQKLSPRQPTVIGPVLIEHVDGPFVSDNNIGLEEVGRVNTDSLESKDTIILDSNVGPGPGEPIIENLDVLVQQAREKGGGELNSQFHFENSNLSSSSSSQPTKDLLLIRKESRSKKFTSRLPFRQIGGPKCLRFVEAINNAGAKWKKRVGSSEGVVTGSSRGLEEDSMTAQISDEA